MMNNNYSKKCHYQLLKQELIGIDSENDSFKYSIMLNAYLDWQNRQGYLKLLEDFQKKKFQNFKFCFVFEERGLLIDDIVNILESNLILLSFTTDEKYSSFATLISVIIDICKTYIAEANAEINDITSEIEFEILMKENYLKILEILKENPTTIKDSTDFSKLTDQLNWEIKDQYFELIEEFLDEDELSNFLNFKKKYESVIEVAKKLESNSVSLEIRYQALGLSNFIYILIQLFDRWKMDSEISPKVFKSWVRKIFAEMKSHYS